MTSLESMKKVLRETGLYRLSGDTAVDAELNAYALALDALRDDFETLERESFAATATGVGLSRWESAYGLAAGNADMETRRAAIMGRGAVSVTDNTREALEQLLSASGCRVRIYERIEPNKANVNFLDAVQRPEERYRMRKILLGFWPAHLDAELDFRAISWNAIDSGEKSFDEMDAAGLAWDQIDCYQNAVLPLEDGN